MKQAKLDWRGILSFLVIAYGLAYLLDLPMFLDGLGLKSPWASLILLRNFTPALATLLVVRWISPLPHARVATGLRRGVRGTGWGWYWLFGWLAFVAFQVASPFVGALFGQFPMDLANFSGYHALLEKTPGGQAILASTPIQTLVLVILITLPLQALLITPFTFGEEWGWRGYLLPRLLPLGQWPALLLSGVIWSFWHAPLFLLGFDYPGRPVLGMFLAVIPFTLLGILLGWTRLASGSVWPAVLGHAGIDSVQQFGALAALTRAGVVYDQTRVFLTGWTGWIELLVVIGFLILTRRLPVTESGELYSGGLSSEFRRVAHSPTE